MTNENKAAVSRYSQQAPMRVLQTASHLEQATELTSLQLDPSNLKQIIDVASGRGAFRPNEMMTVGPNIQ